LATVRRHSLTAQETLTGTLGYAGSWTVSLPLATSAETLGQGAQLEASARAAQATAQASFSADEESLVTAEAGLEAARLKEAGDCAGANAAVGGAPVEGGDGTSAGPATPDVNPCASSILAAEAAEESVESARRSVLVDRAQLSAARAALASARRAYDRAVATSSASGGVGTYTMLPALGDVVGRGQALYAVNGSDTLLLFGSTPAWRGLMIGVSPGRDVAELNENLVALGLGASRGRRFTRSTRQAVEAFQRAHGLPATGSLLLGSVVFEPGAARVVSVTPTVGQSIQPGPIMMLSSTRHEVSIQLDVSRQSQVRKGDRVVVTLPGGRSTPGVVSRVGKVATMAAQGGQGASGAQAQGSPSISVGVRLLRPGDAGRLDQAPVNVLITTATVRRALVVPVTALVALAGGGYAVEEVTSDERRELVPVTPGLFDDQRGLVQVTGVAGGERVVVPVSS
jgi:peptidoglycan hydrolase-like protein with peptidoglycan-binding domain